MFLLTLRCVDDVSSTEAKVDIFHKVKRTTHVLVRRRYGSLSCLSWLRSFLISTLFIKDLSVLPTLSAAFYFHSPIMSKLG